MLIGSMGPCTGRQWVGGISAGVATALVIGVPTGIIGTSFYTRMTPVLWWNYPVWLASAVLAGMIVATFLGPRSRVVATGGRRAVAGGIGSVLAVGCPICNKVVVLLLGASGALSIFAPVQPYLGVLSLLLLAAALRERLRPDKPCPVPAAPEPLSGGPRVDAGRDVIG